MQKFYDVAERVPYRDCKALGIGVSDYRNKSKVRGVRTGEFREPKAGEWYLSGAIPQVWRAPNDLSTKFHICQLVVVEEITIFRIVRIAQYDAEEQNLQPQGG